MTSRVIRAGIIGYGRVGRVREHCILKRPVWELAGLCDVDTALAAGRAAPVYRGWRELLAERPDAVFVCTPNVHFPEIVETALGLGVHVFCEKPPGRTLEDIARMREAERKSPGGRLKFGFNHRYHAAVEEALAIVRGGRLGRVMWLRGIYGKAGGPDYDKNWRNRAEVSGGGILIDQGIHMLDLFRLFCGDFEETKSFVTRSYWPIEVEDNAFALLRTGSGQVAMLHSSATQWQHRFVLDIYLERGYLSLHGILSSTQTYGRESLRVARCLYDRNGYPLPNPEETVTYYDEDDSWQQEVDDFADCILNGRPVSVGTADEAFAAMELVRRIYEADAAWAERALDAKSSG